MASGRGKASRRAANPAGERVKRSNLPATLRYSRERAREEVDRHCYSSSFPRKRESGRGARKTLRRLYCGTTGPDSRFRGNDEILSVDCRLFLRRLAAFRALFVGVIHFLHTLFRGNDEELLENYCLSQHQPFDAPAVAGKAARFLHALFCGNDSVSLEGYFPAQRRFPGAPAAIMRNEEFSTPAGVRLGQRYG